MRSTWTPTADGSSSRKTHSHPATADRGRSKPTAERLQSRWSEAYASTGRNFITGNWERLVEPGHRVLNRFREFVHFRCRPLIVAIETAGETACPTLLHQSFGEVGGAGGFACRWKLISIAHRNPENGYAPGEFSVKRGHLLQFDRTSDFSQHSLP